jgi:hypothetical protein
MEPTIQATNPPLYSTLAIRVFSVFFSPIAGAVLLAQNFRDVGRPNAARKVLWLTIGPMLLLLTILALLPEGKGSGNNGLGIGVGIGGGYALTLYSDSVIPNKADFPIKSIWKPLLICLLIFIPLVTLILYASYQ